MLNFKNHLIALHLGLFCTVTEASLHAQCVLNAKNPAVVQCDIDKEQPVVGSALAMVTADYQAVFGTEMHRKPTGNIIVGTVGEGLTYALSDSDMAVLRNKKQAYLMKVLDDGRLLIAGSDAHGTAYGLMAFSRMIGVSPWEWWADCPPRHKESFRLERGFMQAEAPSVEYRGIFINDEDWGLAQWVRHTYEPQSEYGNVRIGKKTHERIFQLMLRLRANLFWPAMHECTTPFFLVEGNREMALRYGIYIGGSHCEPMACSTAGEWWRRGKGEYDYVNNADNVRMFWENRVREVNRQPIVYTVGMRGVHDGQMNGAKSIDEQRQVLTRVIDDQRAILGNLVNKKVTDVPQVFIPYKEVLDVYNSGLTVPEDITLMWCDDNYGYIRHFPTADERKRKGGNGVYYHISYWGRPHDYLWLGTTSPFLMYQQMSTAYARGIRKMWVVNVGDIKPGEYLTELFLDMAWNMERFKDNGVDNHLQSFFKREFGEQQSDSLCDVMKEYYRLAFIHRPELMGNTRVEETADKYSVCDLPFTQEEINDRLNDYKRISDKVETIAKIMPADRQDAFFQLVKYPVQASAQMNFKMLYAQQGRWNASDAAYDSIQVLTRIYNTGIRNNGKWARMMDCKPRGLEVFEPVKRRETKNNTEMLCTESGTDIITIIQGKSTVSNQAEWQPGLGYDGGAVVLQKGKSAIYELNTPDLQTDSINVEVCLIPSHPIEGAHLRFGFTWDNEETVVVDYATQGRSEEWKRNVLWNRSVRRFRVPVQKKKHRIVIKALDDGIVVDQILVRKAD